MAQAGSLCYGSGVLRTRGKTLHSSGDAPGCCSVDCGSVLGVADETGDDFSIPILDRQLAACGLSQAIARVAEAEKRPVWSTEVPRRSRLPACQRLSGAVQFTEAATVFGDPLAISFHDPGHSDDEDRYLTFGHSTDGRLLVVSHTDRGDRNRIISARVATRRERKIYEDG